MAKYYYQFPLDSERGKQLAKFHRACIDAETKAQKYAKRMGAESYFEDPNFFSGGVLALAFAEPKKVNTDVWRQVYKGEDGTQWFEPNVRTSFGCVKARLGFTPSDVAGRIYKKEPVGWDAVRQLHSLNEWLAFCGFNPSGDKEIDTNAVIGMLKDKLFYTYIEITPMSAPALGRKSSWDGSKAIRAEQLRMKLPTVHVDDFYRIVGADITGATAKPMPDEKDKDEATDSNHPDGGFKVVSMGKKQPQAEPCTPVYFAYQESFFIGLDFPINQEGFKEISRQCFIVRKNQMLRDMDNKA